MNNPVDFGTYDYVVIGSGSAGSAIAARLAEMPSSSVLVLEAGPAADNFWLTWPIGYAKILANPDLMWPFESEPEPNLNGRRISAMRGRVVGGGSSVNGMIYVRGDASDYDTWRQLGNAGWAYKDVLPYFRKAERYERGSSTYHGDDGPIGVEGVRWRNPLAEAFIDAAESVGIPRTDDFCGATMEGVGYYQSSTWKGRRSSAAGYLRRMKAQKNLNLVPNALVTGLILEGRVARGVRFERDGVQHNVQARREVILSSGSIVTPKLLQLSGIGPGALLQEHGIAVAHDLPGVGENLIDHLSAKRGYTTSSSYTMNAMMQSLPAKAWAGLQYLTTRMGPLAASVASAGGFARTRPEVEVPDVQLFMIPFNSGEYWDKLAKASSFQIVMCQLRPESRGHVRIASSDPYASPVIAPNYLSDPRDVQTTLDGMRLIQKIGVAGPLRALESRQTQPQTPDESDESLLSYIRETAITTWHHVGTCKMGNDALAVVDAELKVHGIDRLRVVDGSIMPTLISGNTNAACIMIGEKGADIVKQAAKR
ncbi:MAG: GMC family oxidoreductase N-terminal domain-containing protein [Sphingobium sp.]|uniref:GMC family oxidoreductase n=1 Tax=Sphingobium sp. TaxID=1912891 RepID=UPI0029B8D8D4|nr:GMC family oxidoreductase N-terminal domain-containing protein [Sphingobium sp.]MDX3911534.1 GMC family oxidoreductase N-terminal domain-containing protein [Sphingobium sp.]